MSKFYIIGKISRDLAKRMQSDPNADRGAAAPLSALGSLCILLARSRLIFPII